MNSKQASVFTFIAVFHLISCFQTQNFKGSVCQGSQRSKLMLAQEISGELSRRHILGQIAGLTGASLILVPQNVLAEVDAEIFSIEEVPRVTNTMGGLLEPYSAKGFKLFRPSGWDKFDTSPDLYDVKFVDIINKAETVIISSSPVKSSATLLALGSIQEVGNKLASSRNAVLVSATEKITDGIVSYTFEFSKEPSHEVFQLSINKGKLWSLSCRSPSEKSWEKRAELYRNIAGSFLPKL